MGFVPIREECASCATGYDLSPDRLVCLLQTPSCKSWEINGVYQKKCVLCDKGYYLDQNENCQSQTFISNCVLMRRNFNECETCQLGYKLSVDKLSCTNASDPYCQVYSINGSCLKCQENKKLVGETCSSLDHCRVWNADYSQCQICSNDYSLIGGICVAVPHCDVTIGDRCYKCAVGYYRDHEGVCQQITISNCGENIENLDSCKICSSGFYPNKVADDGSQVTCIPQNVPNCALYMVDSNKN